MKEQYMGAIDLWCHSSKAHAHIKQLINCVFLLRCLLSPSSSTCLRLKNIICSDRIRCGGRNRRVFIIFHASSESSSKSLCSPLSVFILFVINKQLANMIGVANSTPYHSTSPISAIHCLMGVQNSEWLKLHILTRTQTILISLIVLWKPKYLTGKEDTRVMVQISK